MIIANYPRQTNMIGLYHGVFLPFYLFITFLKKNSIDPYSPKQIELPALVYFSEMIEAVGHEYMEEFFGCCESALAADGLFVLQVITYRILNT